jgi:hypothetical protein
MAKTCSDAEVQRKLNGMAGERLKAVYAMTSKFQQLIPTVMTGATDGVDGLGAELESLKTVIERTNKELGSDVVSSVRYGADGSRLITTDAGLNAIYGKRSMPVFDKA